MGDLMKIKRILLLGHNKWACLVLERLLRQNYDVVGIVTETDAFDFLERQNYERFKKFGAYESLKDKALSLRLEVFQPDNINEERTIEKLQSLTPDIVVMVSYHSLLKETFLGVFKIINVHGAPLPKYRGRAPINWAIINGENSTAVTVHHVIKKFDAGNIIAQQEIPIYDKDWAIDVLIRSLPVYPEITIKALQKLEDDPEYGIPQNEEESTYFPRRTPKDGGINWKINGTLDIYNKIRALAYPYPGARAKYKEREIILNSSAIVSETRLSPTPGVIIRSNRNGVYVTTIDGIINIKTLIENEMEIEASQTLKTGEKLK